MIKYKIEMERVERSTHTFHVEVPDDAGDADLEAIRKATEKAVDFEWDWIGEVDYQYNRIEREG